MTCIPMKEILPTWTFGSAIGHRHLTLIPLLSGGPRFDQYLLASEAIDAGKLKVTEVSDVGTVPELLAINDADQPVLLIDGEELQGAKQNRILNTSVLLPARSKTRIPVSCVEEGRWSHVSSTFKSGHYAPSSLRQRKSRDVQKNLRDRGRAESNQGAVWESVIEQIEAFAVQSPTRAMSDAMSNLAQVLERYHQALPCPLAACGVVAAVCGRFVALDAFDSPSTLEAIWSRLVASYAMDAEAATEKTDKIFSAKAAGMLCEHLAGQTCESFGSVGLGRDLRFQADDIFGQALDAERHLLHLSVFPRSDHPRNHRRMGPTIQPPSHRRDRLDETEWVE